MVSPLEKKVVVVVSLREETNEGTFGAEYFIWTFYKDTVILHGLCG